MPTYPFDILALTSELENESFLAEALFFPELCRLEESGDKALDNLRDSLPAFLDKLPTLELHRRRVPKELEVRQVEVEVKPSKRGVAWSEPVTLLFHAVCWQQRGTHHGFIPCLTVEVVADSAAELEQLLPQGILQDLQRRDVAGSLQKLLWLQRTATLAIQPGEVELKVDTPRKKMEAELKAGPEPSVLKEVATNLNLLGMPVAYGMDEQVRRLAEMLRGSQGRSVLLVGPSGVGKTALAKELVRQRRHYQLSSAAFWETTGSRLMVGADGFGDWQERCRLVVAQASRERAILLLGNLFELAEVARHATTPQGMAGFFRPYIERGDLLCIVECTPAQRDLLERDHPHLMQAFSVLKLEAPDSATCRSILRSAIPHTLISDAGIDCAESLHRRYARYSAYPGRPLYFLAELGGRRKESEGQPLQPSEIAAAFAAETGLPRFIVDDSQPLDLRAAREFFARNILGQEHAVELVVDLMASVKACLTPPGRPIASLLFIGPTGVGKTEMARALAAYLFSDRKRMVRFDMSEFADPLSVERLVGGQGAGQGLLTAKVREQPFGVVLFDELEKADPAFFDLLLQILGEGRLTDEGGRVADFTNSVIVMTSNLGAASFSKGPLGFRGADESERSARQEFTSAVKASFRPELFNRIDRLVPFSPLDRDTATRVAVRELERLMTRDGLLSDNLQLQLEGEVARYLAQSGYDRRYGARPLKRAIERALLEPLAAIAGRMADRKTVVTVKLEGCERPAEADLQEAKLVWSVNADNQPRRPQASSAHGLADVALGLRRKAQKLAASRQAHTLRNQVQRLRKLQARKKRSQYMAEELLAQLGLLDPREKLVERLEHLQEHTQALETEAVLSLEGFSPSEPTLRTRLEQQELSLTELALDLYASNFDDPDRATLVVYAEKGMDPRLLISAYAELWKAREVVVTTYRLSLGPREKPEQKDDPILRIGYGEESDDRALWCEEVDFKDGFKGEPAGIAFELQGQRILPLMLSESGLHAFGGAKPRHLEVVVQPERLRKYLPPDDLHYRHSLAGPSRRRLYNEAQGLVEDLRLDRRRPWNGKGLEKILGELLPAELMRVAMEACS